jgi:hypothetical protein
MLVVAAPASAQSIPRVRDSSGVRIVENGARMTAPVKFVLSEKPVLEVGGLEDDLTKEFNQRQGYLRGVLLSMGDLAVIDVNRVHLFDATGKRKVITGREGSGPGEFRYLTSICRTRGDTIVVSDNRNRRTTILDGNGAFVRSIPQPDGASPPFEGCLADGTFLLEKIIRFPGPNNTISGFVYSVARHRLDGSLVDSIGTFNPNGLDMATQREPTVFAGGNRIGFADGRGEILLAAPAPAAVSGRKLTVGGTEVMAAPGSVTIIRSADPPEPISDADRESRLMQTIPRGTSADEIRQRMERMRATSTDKNWPAYRRVHLDDDDRLWVQDFNKDYFAAHGWTAFDASGRMIGRLMIPAATRRFEIIGFAHNQVLVVRKDEDDALHLSVYAIKPVAGK